MPIPTVTYPFDRSSTITSPFERKSIELTGFPNTISGTPNSVHTLESELESELEHESTQAHLEIGDEVSQGGFSASQSESELLALKKDKMRGIMCVAAGFCCNFMCFGIAFTYGIFQDYYTSPQGPLYLESASKVALIGTTGTALTYSLGVFNKTLSYYLRSSQLMLIGSIIMSLGLILTGFATKYTHFVLTQGVMFGIGSSLLYLPPVVCSPAYFNERRSLAMGIVFSGTGFGALAMAGITNQLIKKVGWQWCVRILGFLNLVVTASVSFLVHEPRSFSSIAQSRGLFQIQQLGSVKVWLQLTASCLQSAGYLIPLIFMSKYGKTLGYSETQGALFIGVNNAVNAVFKVILGYGADRIGRMNMISICSFFSASAIFGLWLVGSKDTYIPFVVLYGVFSGAIIALLPTCLVELFGMQNYQALSGLMYFVRGIGSMLGSPIAGLFIKDSGLVTSDYTNLIIYNGVLLLASTICIALLRGIVSFPNNKFKWRL